MYAWEPSFMKKVQNIRNQEIQKLRKYAILTATTIVFAIHSPFMVIIMCRSKKFCQGSFNPTIFCLFFLVKNIFYRGPYPVGGTLIFSYIHRLRPFFGGFKI